MDQQLDRLVKEGTLESGTLESVEFSEWASPIVKTHQVSEFVDKQQSSTGILSLKVEDLFATLSGGQAYSKLDLSQAYQQLPLDEHSKKYVVINTHRGLFRYTRLHYGISFGNLH